MTVELLQLFIYFLLGIAVTFYVVLDGFDLGVGSLLIFAGKDKNKRVFLNSIGPFWDGNETWLVIIVGVMFVGFPDMYAALLSGLYVLLMCFLCAIIFRAVSIEFRSKHPSPKWRMCWDFLFWLSSLVITFGAGLALGNLIHGVPIDADRELFYPFASLFGLYPIFVGVLSIFLFAMHGVNFLLMKTEGEVQERVQRWAPWTLSLFIITFFVMTVWTWIKYPFMVDHFIEYPVFWLVPALLLCVLAALCYFTWRARHGFAFLMSMITIALLFILYSIGTFPMLVISSISRDTLSLTLWNASSSETTMKITFIIACIGVPLVLAYGCMLYHIFRGKTQLHDHSY